MPVPITEAHANTPVVYLTVANREGTEAAWLLAERHYGDLNDPTFRNALPIRVVPIEAIRVPQQFLGGPKLEELRQAYRRDLTQQIGEDLPFAVRHRGLYYLYKGIHRAEAQAAEGALYIRMHICDVD